MNLTHRFASAAFALVLTTLMLAGIDQQATAEPSPQQMAHAQPAAQRG